MAAECKELYPDIFTPIPVGEKPETGATARKNKERRQLYLAVREVLRRDFAFDPDDNTTRKPENFPAGFGKQGSSTSGPRYEERRLREIVLFTSVYGLLRARSYDDPSLGKLAVLQREAEAEGMPVLRLNGAQREIRAYLPDADDAEDPDVKPGPNDIVVEYDGVTVLIVGRFIEAVTEAVKRHNANRELFAGVYRILQYEGRELDNDGNVVSMTLICRQLAEVTGRLVEQRIDPDDPHLRRHVVNALSQSLGGHIEGSASDIDIDLPDLDTGTAVDIVKNNVRAVAAIYFSAMLEEMRYYAVAEKVAEHFMIGMVPISRGAAGDRIYRWIKEAPDRFNEIERRSVYGRVLGQAQGSVTDLVANREFSDLWIRCLSTISLMAREEMSTEMRRVSQEQALKTARDLAVNLSLHGYGIAHPAAVEMQKLINQIHEMLGSPELLMAYGVNDIWQLTDRLNQMYLGGYVNGVRFRTMAQAGSNIILWLADNAPKLASVSAAGGVNFRDHRLVRSVERWLAVTGTPDASVEQYTDPVDLKSQPSVPGFAPTNGSVTAGAPIIRSALEQAGIDNLPAIPQA